MPSTLLLPPPSHRIFRTSYGPSENEIAEIKKTSLCSIEFFLMILQLKNLFNIGNRALTCSSVFQQVYISELHQ